jgi:hypothetical protein
MEDSLSMNIINQKDNTDIYTTSDITQSSTVDNSTLLFAIISLLEDHHYWVNVAVDIGSYIRVSGNSPLSTFDIQDINVITNINGLLCMNIKYISGAIADSCHVELNCSDYRYLMIIYDIIGTAGCINDIPIDGETTCILKGYDKVNDVIEDQNGPAVVVDDVIISGELIMSTMTATVISTTSINPSVSPTLVPIVIVITLLILGIPALVLVVLIVCSIVYVTKSKKQKLVINPDNKAVYGDGDNASYSEINQKTVTSSFSVNIQNSNDEKASENASNSSGSDTPTSKTEK